MADPAPETKLWIARENQHKDARPKDPDEHKDTDLYLLVGGQVEVSDADKQPVLTEGQARDPHTLALDLAIVDCKDPPAGAAVWKAAKFHRDVEADQYRRVEVRWDGKAIADCPVIDDRERAALMNKQAKVQNTSAEVKAKIEEIVSGAKKKAAAPKTTAEKIKTVAKVAKKVGSKPAKAAAKKTAKKAAKKTAPKKAAPKKAAPKKAARRSAKASPLKKLVKKLVKKLTPAKKKGKKKR